MLDGVVDKAVGGGVVDLDWRGRLWVTQFVEYGAYWYGFLAIHVGGANLCLAHCANPSDVCRYVGRIN